jgi:pantoate--beta-alanine ligase
VEVTGSRERFRGACEQARASGAAVALVPTMGALHAGHRSLLARAREDGAFVAMTLFVNPLQFADAADLAAYPRTREGDLDAAANEGVDLVFAPDEAEMYPSGTPEVGVDPGPLGGRLEGASRPGHFRGVLTVVAKLFALAGPCRAYFGQKDAQQLELVRRMVRDLNLPVDVIACATVREPDGLALSSRNARLTPAQRAAAAALHRALDAGADRIASGERRPAAVIETMAAVVSAALEADLDYAALVDDASWGEPAVAEGTVRLLVAASFGEVRLIDNRSVSVPAAARDVPAERAQ